MNEKGIDLLEVWKVYIWYKYVITNEWLHRILALHDDGADVEIVSQDNFIHKQR